jgi:P4 family phage/plasmid primase-like protien
MTIELLTGIDRPADPLDYITKEAGTWLADPGTPCPLWMNFLNRVTNNNDALIGFLQRFLGYCMTGYVHEHVLVFLYGTGANGKTVFVETVAGVFGDYCIPAPMEMFLTAKFDRHPTEIARLQGVRLVTAQETPKGRSWDEAKIKNLTGAGTLTARFMRGNFFNFKPTFKLLIAGNYKPALHNVDEAIRRRILLVPFTVCIPEAERDRKLAEKLKAEWPAILRWILDGCLEYQRVGLVVPTIVRDATDAYLSEQDNIRQWADVAVVPSLGNFILTDTLFGSWKRYCEKLNLSPGEKNAFSDELADRLGYARERRNYGRGFKDIDLKELDQPEDQYWQR